MLKLRSVLHHGDETAIQRYVKPAGGRITQRDAARPDLQTQRAHADR